MPPKKERVRTTHWRATTGNSLGRTGSMINTILYSTNSNGLFTSTLGD